MRPAIRRVYEMLASLHLAIGLLAVLAVVLAVGTAVESRAGTPAAQALVYRSWWFSGLLGLLGVNVACSAAIRYPWKISQVGFVVTHAGILLVLAGSILTQRIGVEGQVFLREGSGAETMTLDRTVLQVHRVLRTDSRVTPDVLSSIGAVPLSLSRLARGGRGPGVSLADGSRVRVDGYSPAMREILEVEPAAPGAAGNPAVLLRLDNPRMDVHAERWLVGGDPERSMMQMGPAEVRFVTGSDPPPVAGVNRLTLIAIGDGVLRYRVESRKGHSTGGAVIPGRAYPTGWMPGLTFTVARHLPRARVTAAAEPRPTAPGEEIPPDATPGVKVVWERQGAAAWTGWLTVGGSRRASAGRQLIEVGVGDEVRPLPYRVDLVDFRVGRDPGTNKAASYESDVVLTDPARGARLEQRIWMNHPFVYRGTKLFQASFVEVPPGAPEISILQFSHDPGVTMKYGGSFLVVLGIALMFYVKPRVGTGLVPALLLASSSFAADPLAAARAIAIQDHGRVKPLDTFARETLLFVTGREAVGSEDSVATLLGWMFEGERWIEAPIVRVSGHALKDHLGLSREASRFSYRDLVGRTGLWRHAQAAGEKVSRKQTLSPEEEEAAAVVDRLRAMDSLFIIGHQPLRSLRIIPDPSDPQGAWASPVEGAAVYGDAKARDILKALGELGIAVRDARPANATRAGEALLAKLRALPSNPAVYPSPGALAREIHYNHLKPFRKAWWVYLASVILLGVSFYQGTGGGPSWPARFALFGFAAAGIAFGLHTYGIVLRSLIAGRPPVSNMYETVIWVPWGAMAFAILFEAIWRARYYVAGASAFATLTLILADALPTVLPPGINPLEPVLRSNYWLTVHVLTITLSYGAMAVALGVGHAALWQAIRGRPERLSTLAGYCYRAIQVGVLLLAAGTILGGVWANESWGRFWGWDPKETWALIALLTYLIPLHGRHAGWLTDFGLAVASVLGFLTILMAWYGVNFVLGKGLHSYGFGTGGLGYVIGLVVVEVAYVAWAWASRPKASA